MTTRNRQLTAIVDGETYYAAQKAQEILGMTYSAVRNQVIAGNITAKTPKGKRQLYYRAKDVEQLSREFKVYTMNRRNKPTKFEMLTTREEMRQCQEISLSLFGVRGELDDLMKTVEKNPETYYVLKDEDQVVGYTALWPLKPDKLNGVLKQTLPVQISPDDIEVYAPGRTVDIFLTVIGVKPDFDRETKRLYGARLISGLMGIIIGLGAKEIKINTIAARSNMPEGIKLMKGLGFTEVEPLTPERRTFIIDVQNSGIPFILQYKKEFEETKQS